MKRRYNVAVIAGDGIGKEVVPAAMEVLERASERHGFELSWTHYPWGCEYFAETGTMMPPNGLEVLGTSDAIFLGAVGYPGVADHVSLWGLLIPIRRGFQQYINYRPARLFPGITGPLRSESPIDLAIVRENNEGEYSEIGGRLYRGLPEEFALQEAVFTRRGVERVVRFAFELAAKRNGVVMSATKSNGIIHTMPFWDEFVEEIAQQYPKISSSKMHIDALAAKFVLDPGQFDVVVGSNLFGDILSDLSAAVTGSIGIAPSANLNPERQFPSMFEPVHGSAPDIAGHGIANPIGQIWSGALMLEHLGEQQAARDIEEAIEHCLTNTAVRTPDLGGRASTNDVVKALIDAMASSHEGRLST